MHAAVPILVFLDRIRSPPFTRILTADTGTPDGTTAPTAPETPIKKRKLELKRSEQPALTKERTYPKEQQQY